MTITTIDKVVRAAIAEAGYKNLRKYILYLHFAFDALYKNKRDNVMLSFRFISLPVVNRIAVVPATVLAMGQIGQQRGQYVQGNVSGPNLSLDPAAQPNLFVGFGSCQGIKYRIDRSTNPVQIIFDTQPPLDVVYVEVIDAVDTPTTETLVNSEGVLPIKSYIHFRAARFKMGAASAEAVQAEKGDTNPNGDGEDNASVTQSAA